MGTDFNKEINIRLNHTSMLVISGIIGLAWFLALYGLECIDVTNVNWIYNSFNDITPHYIGWVYYRNSDWSFPLGVFSGLTGKYNNSIVYTDSIPLFAIVFKLLRGILPQTFQYFGLFSVMSVVLQAVCGSELVYRLTGKTLDSLLSSVFFLSATILSMRLFEHTSLTAHFIILLALILFFEDYENKKKILVLWNFLLVLAVLVHAYYVPMVLAFELFYNIKGIKCKEGYKRILKDASITALHILVSISVVIGMMYIVGYFEGVDYSVDNDTLGLYGTSLNAFISSNGYSLSSMLVGIASNEWNLEEGYAYLGAGLIVLATVSICYYIKNWKRKEQYKLDILVMILIVCFIIISMIPTIRWNWTVIARVPLPALIQKVLGMFRSNGRFIWPAIYLIILSAVAVISRKSKYAKGFLIACVLLQAVDLLPYYMLQSGVIKERERVIYSSSLLDNISDEFGYIMLMDEPNSDDGFGFDETCKIGIMASNCNAVMSDFYMARKDEKILTDERQRVSNELDNGIINDGYLYVFGSIPYDKMVKNLEINYYSMDGMVCATNSQVDGAEMLNIHDGINMLAVNGYVDVNISISEASIAESTSERVAVAPGHIMYRGANLPKGIYMIELCGEGLSKASASIASSSETKGCSVDYIESDDDCIIARIDIAEDNTSIYIQYANVSDSSFYVDSIKIYY